MQTTKQLQDKNDNTERKLERCRSRYFDLEWRFNELKKIVKAIFESHNLKRLVGD